LFIVLISSWWIHIYMLVIYTWDIKGFVGLTEFEYMDEK
jgi:hypothetical protein